MAKCFTDKDGNIISSYVKQLQIIHFIVHMLTHSKPNKLYYEKQYS